MSTKIWKLPPPLQIFHDVYSKKQKLLPLIFIPLKSKILIIVEICHLFRGLTPLKIENFEQKLKISTTTPNFSWCHSKQSLLLLFFIPLKSIFFFGISSLFMSANTFKNREFRPKIENFHHHLKIFMMLIMRNNIYYLSPAHH